MKELPAVLGGAPVFSETVSISRATLPEFDAVVDSYRDIFSTGMVTNGKYLKEFEERMARYLGVAHAVGVSSASTGLLLTFKALGLKGEVIVPSFTFSMTGHALAWNGLRPVFVDIDPETCVIDPEKVEKAITPDTCAILGVHIWGNPCQADRLQEIADRHNIPLLFDAAQGTGSRYLERPVGGFGNAEVLSLSPTKLVVSGEGGIVATNDAELARRVRIGRAYGDDGSYDCLYEGMNARMSELHAVLGLASLEMADKNIAHRLKLFDLYRSRLRKLPGIQFQKITPGGVPNGVYFSIIIDSERFGLTRDQLYEALKAEHVDTRRYYHPPMHRQSVNAHLAPQYEGKLPNTDKIAANSLTLPMFSHMTEEQVKGVCQAIERLHAHREEVRKRMGAAATGGHR